MKLVCFSSSKREKSWGLMKDGCRMDASVFGAEDMERFFASEAMPKLVGCISQSMAPVPAVQIGAVRLMCLICRSQASVNQVGFQGSSQW